MIKRDLNFEDFCGIYETDIYCAYMETGCSYDMELESFEELEYEAYIAETGQWSRDEVPPDLDKPLNYRD